MRAGARVSSACARSERAIAAGMLSGFSTARADRCIEAGLWSLRQTGIGFHRRKPPRLQIATRGAPDTMPPLRD
jgi:hypothetical protein